MIGALAVPNNNITPRWPNMVALLTAASISVLGLMVLTGWYTHNTLLLRVLPGFVPMAYNTALGFFLAGAGLLLVLGLRPIRTFRKSRVGISAAGALGTIVAALGLLTLAQYAVGVQLGVDQFLMTDYTFGQTASQTAQFAPGRMALNTAICFTLTGFALIAMATGPERLRQRALTLGVLGSLVVATAAVPLVGYLTGQANAYGWGALTRMALHTAAGFVAMGASIVALAWQEERSGKRGAPGWLPVLVGIGTVVATLILWQALFSEQRSHTQRMVTSETAVMKNQIAERMGSRILVLTRFAARRAIYGAPSQHTWEADAASLVGPGSVNRAVEWVDTSFQVRWIASSDGKGVGSLGPRNTDLSANPQVRAALEMARDQNSTVVTQGENLPDGSRTILVGLPTFRGEPESGAAQQPDGFVVGVFEANLLFESLIGDETARGYSMSVQSGAAEVYVNHEGDRGYYAELHQEATIDLPGTTWRISVWPRSALVAESESPLPVVVLISGLAMAVLLALAMYFAQAARSRTRQVEVTNLELAREIAERKRAEADRSRLFSTSLDMVGIARFDGYFKDVNPSFEEVLGFSSDEVCATPFLDFVHPDDRAATLSEMEKLSAGVLTLSFQNRYLCKDGTYKWIDWKAVPVAEEGLIYAVGRDMTERKRAEEEIKGLNRDLERRVVERTAEFQTTNQELEGEITQRKLAAERTAFLVQASTTLASSLDYENTLKTVARIAVPRIADWCNVDIVDEDGQVQRVTLAHADPAKEAKAYDYLRRFPPKPNSDRGVNMVLRTLEPILMPRIDAAMIEASVTGPEQLQLLREFRPTSAMVVPLVAHGRAVGAISLLTAESGREYGPEDLVLAEEVARRAAIAVENAKLYRQEENARSEAEAVGEQLKKTVTELERSNQELQQFAYVASHDLQEPLRMVASYTQLLSRRYKGKLDESADDFIGYAVDGANRMQRLINDLLAYSRVSTQGRAFERTDCEAVLKQALANLRITLQESKAVVSHDPLPTVMGDDVQLVQLFQNLIANASKFHGEEPPAVHVGIERKGSEWLFRVRDNGIGMDAQYADRIFVIFQRLHSKEEYPGTGIGLSVCKKVVERHGGRIWVESRPGEGSTFYFTLPAIEA